MVDIFLQTVVLSSILFVSILFLLKKNNKLEKKGRGERVIGRWGGAVLVIVFCSMVLVNPELELTRQINGIIVGNFAILVFGLLDDWKNFSWKSQLAFQFLLVGILIFSGFNIDYLAGLNNAGIRLDYLIWQGISIGSSIFIFLWIVGIINAVNWSDGVDSSMGSIAVVGGMSVVFVSFLPEVNQPAVAILASIFLGSVVSFLFFNLPPAKVEAGTVGSYFVGFILASLAIIAGSKIVAVMIILILPLTDFIWVVMVRVRRGQSIFKRDKQHLHYRLRKMGWSDVKIFFNYIFFLSVILVSYSLLSSRLERFLLLGGEVFLLVVFFIWLHKKV